ncbi:MAG TPA: GAF domain-containing protein [Actinomycetes bacterium]|jgi:signal transduction histidine kinase|nr:GAF domain-containing protein [Actinomycetes bacterium]
MVATADWPTASTRRANALVIGRWCGVAVITAPLTYQLFTHGSMRATAALAAAAVVAALNFYQRRLLLALHASSNDASRAAARTAGNLVARIRRTGRVLLGLDSVLIVLAALALADEPSGGFWALLGWLPVEGAIAEGTVTAVVSGALAVFGVVAYDVVQRGAAPSLAPGNGLLVRVVDLIGVTAAMIGLERSLAKGERAMTERAQELSGLVDRERHARTEVEALSTIVLAGVANQGDIDGTVHSMTRAVASHLDYERMALFLLDGDRLRCHSWFGDWPDTPSFSLPLGPGSIVGRVAATGAAVLVEEPARHPDYFAAAPDTKSEMCVPLRFGDRILGVVNVESPRSDTYTTDDLERLQRLADQMAVVVDNARLLDAQRALADRESAAKQEIEAVSRAVVAGVKVGSYQAALDHMLAEVAEVLGYEALCFAAPDGNGRLRIRGAAGFPVEVVERQPLVGEAGITGRVFASERPMRSGKAEPGSLWLTHDGRMGTASELAVPVRLEGKMLGVLTARSSDADAFNEEDMARLSRIADQLAMVIERARLAEGEAETNARLRQLDQMRDDFVAMTTHELRTPLTVIRGFTATLLRPGISLDPDEQRHFVQVIDRQTARLARLVEDLLLVSRMQAGMLDVSLAVHDPVGLLTDYAEEWPTEPARVFLEIGHDLPNVRTDPDRLAQVMRNLVDNAQRYGGGSPIRVTARRVTGELVIEVKDQGPGIAPGELPYVFERFRQAGSSSAHRAGMGLGLYITKALVNALGGTIEVESSSGRGTTFRVRLPAERARSLPSRSNITPFMRRQAPGG